MYHEPNEFRTFVIAFIKMAFVDMHLHLQPLLEAAVEELTLPFLFAAVSHLVVAVEKFALVVCVGALV